MCENYKWSKYTILVTEDDPMNFKYLELLLTKKAGANIIWAKNGTESIQQIQQTPAIDIVLLDLLLPDIHGLDVLKTIKKHRPNVPVIIQTANTWNDENQVCKEAGADAFFTKPINIDSFLTQINDFLIQKELLLTN